MSVDRRTTAAVCGLAAVAWALAVPLLGGALQPGYSQLAQFISELGASGAAHGGAVSLLGFAPTGALLLAFLALVVPLLPPTRQARVGIVALTTVGIAYLVSALFRCDAGCPSDGSRAQSIHNLFGLLEYVGAFIGLRLLGAAFRQSAQWRPLAALSSVAALAVGVGFLAMLSPGLEWCRGLSQRLAESGIFTWIGAVSVALLRARQ